MLHYVIKLPINIIKLLLTSAICPSLYNLSIVIHNRNCSSFLFLVNLLEVLPFLRNLRFEDFVEVGIVVNVVLVTKAAEGFSSIDEPWCRSAEHCAHGTSHFPPSCFNVLASRNIELPA